MQPSELISVWSAAHELHGLSRRWMVGSTARASFEDVLSGSVLHGRGEELRDRSVLIMTKDQFTAALSIFELDGIARRIVLYPPDMPPDYMAAVIASAEVDAVVSNRVSLGPSIPHVQYFMPCADQIVRQTCDRRLQCPTEWVMLTSGTSGVPKLVSHTLSSLAGAIRNQNIQPEPTVWSTFYDIRRFGGVQIFLRATLGGTSFVMSGQSEPVSSFLKRAADNGVTHISGTPSHWRRALMSGWANVIAPEYVRLSGEIADEAILSHLRATYPKARIVHAFATTEAGLAFEVNDVAAGFPSSFLEDTPGVEMKIRNGTLRVRSDRTAKCYLDRTARQLRDADGFVDTGDLIEPQEGRYYFIGQREGLINVGGLKVHPEEVECVINRHPDVQVSLVRARKSPVTGAVVVADIVLKKQPRYINRDMPALREEIVLFCREVLSPHKIPAAINFVPNLDLAESGKLMRNAS